MQTRKEQGGASATSGEALAAAAGALTGLLGGVVNARLFSRQDDQLAPLSTC
jgi:hypothetical protein